MAITWAFVALATATVVLTPFALLDPPVATPSAQALGAVAILAVFCIALAFVMYVALLREVGPSRAAVITYVAPVVAVGLGVAVLGERPGGGAVAGLLLILVGSWLSADGRLPPGLSGQKPLRLLGFSRSRAAVAPERFRS